MATLTETSFFSRKIINIGAILIVLIIVARIVIMGASGLYDKLFPKPPAAPTLAFGLLPQPAASNNISTPSGSLTYSLETPDGGLPALPFTFRVYFMPHTASSFGSFDQMKATATSLNFTGTPDRTSATTWHFVDTTNPLRTIDIDEISQNFRIKYNYLSDQSLFSEKNFSSEDQIIAGAQAFFTSLKILPPEFKGGSTAVAYYKFDSGALVRTTALANADAVGVTLFRANIDNLPVLSPDFNQGLVSILFSGSGDPKKQVLEARFLVAPIDLENWATYAPITAQDAWTRLQSGRAIFASLPTPMSNTIVIRKVYPAYLDPYPSQSFLQPVLVFSDEKGFVAYVPLMAK